jgi:hypothetical protein
MCNFQYSWDWIWWRNSRLLVSLPPLDLVWVRSLLAVHWLLAFERRLLCSELSFVSILLPHLLLGF